MAAYCTTVEFVSFVEDGTVEWTTTSEANLEKLLAAAERDVDAWLAPFWGETEANGRLFGSPKTTNEKALTAGQVRKLTDLTCARAEYRALKGAAFFAEDERESVEGPDFSFSGKLDRVGPKVREHLRRSGLTARPVVGG